MIQVFLTGEGKTDMGRQEVDGQYIPGPCAVALEREIHASGTTTLFGKGWTVESSSFVPKPTLIEWARDRRSSPILPKADRPLGTALFFQNARALANIARARANGHPFIAVLFRDADTTGSSAHDHWEQAVSSAQNGFSQAECLTGVVMIPKPKSEAWWLCGLKSAPYEHCDRLENASGNDASPNSLKKQLRSACDAQGISGDGDSLVEMIRTGRIQTEKLEMPSYRAFRASLLKALQTLTTVSTQELQMPIED